MLFNSVDKKSFAYKMAGMSRRQLTPEEQEEARRLNLLWNDYRQANPGSTQSWLALAAGLGTQGAVSQYLRGAIPLNLHALVSICRVIDGDPYYVSSRLMNSLHGVAPRPVMAGAHEMGAEKKPTYDQHPHFIRVEAAHAGDPRFTLIPKVRLCLTAGISGFAVEAEEYEGGTTAIPTEWMAQRGFSAANLIAIQVRGESMEPTFYEGDLVVLNTADTRPVDGGVYAINYEGEPVVKRMTRDAGDWWLTSDNADQRKFHRKICRGEACIVIGRIVRRETERF